MASRPSTARRDDETGEDNTVTAINDTLKTFGVDTDVMAEAAKEKAADLQSLVAEELKNRPLRALGVAMAVGAIFGMLASR